MKESALVATLLLNASFEPLSVVSVRRAVLLVLAGKADVVAEGDAHLRSVRLTLAMPRVIRLRTYVVVPYRAAVAVTRRAVAVRDGGSCQYCGRHVGDRGTIDHVVPRSRFLRRDEAHRWENVVLACRGCNSTKQNRTLDELGWTLARPPVALTRHQWLVVGYADAEPTRAPYLPAV